MVIAALSLTVAGSERKQVVRSLRAQSGATRVEHGCLACRVLEDVDDPGHLLYLEKWDSTEHLVARLRSKRYRQLLAVMEESVALPQLEFLWVSEARGMEYLQAARLEPLERTANRGSESSDQDFNRVDRD